MSKSKLLLADDSITIQKVVNLTFADEGIDVISVGDGNSAMDKIREESPDLIMVDVNMPGLNGYEICEKVRQTEGDKRTPVILLVGTFEPFDEAEAERVGADEYLTKPFQSINQLVNAVTVLLSSENGDGVEELPAEIEATVSAEADEGNSVATYHDNTIDDEMIQTDQVGGAEIGDLETFESGSEIDDTRSGSEITSEDHEPPMLADIHNSDEAEFRDFAIIESDEDSDIADLPTDEDQHDPVGAETEELEFEGENVEDTAGFETAAESESSENDYSDGEVYQEENRASDEGEVSLDERNLLEVPVVDSVSAVSVDEGNIDDDLYLEAESGDHNPTKESGHDEAIIEPDFETLAEESVDTEDSEMPPISDEAEVEETGDTVSPKAIEEVTSRVDANPDQEEPRVEVTDGADSISDDVIEEITRRVIEGLSEKAVKDVAWEVVPQMTERIVRQIAEEKMNE